ncbi:hypothetical protein Taro_029956 [Colocasia esculenta]|uniref:Uncharacterized protein n=1 Tax=Colocasia esculenta TaxID=4460 RepID=A0A843W1V1_COLES|nr:hypothetical protein [Colocasia esculenta]
MQSEVEENHDFPQPFSSSPALQTCYSRPQLGVKPSPRTTPLSISKLSSTRMAGADHSCPAPSDSTGSSSLPEKGQDDRVSELAQ